MVNQDFDGGDINGAAIPFAQLHTLRDQDYSIRSHELRLDIDINDQLSAMVGYYDFASDLDFRQDTNNVLQLPTFAIGLPAGVPCGAIGFRSNATPGLEAFCQFPNARSTQLAGETVDSSAIFGSVTFRPTDAIELTLGARYIDESKQAYNGYTDFSFNAADNRVANPVYDDTTAPGYNEHNFRGLESVPGLPTRHLKSLGRRPLLPHPVAIALRTNLYCMRATQKASAVGDSAFVMRLAQIEQAITRKLLIKSKLA